MARKGRRVQPAQRTARTAKQALLNLNEMASIQPEADVVYITSAEVLSVRERMHSPKRYVYEVIVDWSNSRTTTCYRGYTDFFDFQCELLSTFPFEGGAVKGVPRTIPFLPGRKIFQRSTATLAEKRLPQINGYVRQLVAMPEKVSRSSSVLKFFRANWQEDRLRGGSFSVPRQSSRSELLFHEEGGVEYSVRRLDEGGEGGYRNSYSLSPPSEDGKLRLLTNNLV